LIISQLSAASSLQLVLLERRLDELRYKAEVIEIGVASQSVVHKM